MFTFLTLSYNQEKYIIQHLESIKYQIVNYSPKEKPAFILADDSSGDRTVEWAKVWLEENQVVFADITILENRDNQGIVGNYLKGINAVKPGGQMKCLAADDVYYKRNIFNTLEGQDVVLTPIIWFDDTYNVSTKRYYMYKSCAGLEGESLKEKINHGLNHQNMIQAPGAFINLELLHDQGLQTFLRQFTWIEDYPQWYYLFNLYEKEIKVNIDLKPYILYRMSSGISLNKKHSKRDVFLDEEAKISKMVKNKREGHIKFLSAYTHLLDMWKTEYLDSYIDPQLRSFRKQMIKDAKNANLYLKELDKRDKLFRLKYI